MSANQSLNIVGIRGGAAGVFVGLSTRWVSWTWLSVAGLVLCLIAAPSIWWVGKRGEVLGPGVVGFATDDDEPDP